MKKNLFCLIILLHLSVIKAQNYQPIDTADYLERKAFVKDFKTKNEKHIKFLKENYSGKTGKELVKIYAEFEAFFTKEIEEKNYTFKSEFEKYIVNIISELRKNNPNVSSNLKVLIAKNNNPNAYCLANGTLIINMGLFTILDNEDQLTSVISHELAHKIKEHALKSQLIKIKENENNKNIISSLKEIKYDKSLKAFDVFKKQTYAKGVLNKKQEIESDSLGYALFLKTKYKKNEFYNALENLKKIDSINPIPLREETYKQIFIIQNQPFKESWFNSEDFSKYNYNHYTSKLNKDSISSHPEINERLAFLKKNFKELNEVISPIEAQLDFKKLKKIAEMEFLPNLYYEEKHGLGIYTCLINIQENIQKDYNIEWLGRFLEKVYTGRKEYKLNNYLDQIEPKKQSKSYIKFLDFMWHLKLEEIKSFADKYKKPI
ncbi:MAG: M48 family metalloprotease [Bacteroidota bacterium]